MRRVGERLLLGLGFAVLPALLVGLVILPSLRRQGDLRRRIQEANAQIPLPSFTRVGPEERAFLEAPGAPWRSRLARVGDGPAQVDHAHRVVSQVGAALGARGLRATSLGATWAPVAAHCTLPASLRRGAGPAPASGDVPEVRVGGWVLEVGLAGSPGALLEALGVLGEVNPLLEPVGLRWELQPRAGRMEPRQVLCLRNLVLVP